MKIKNYFSLFNLLLLLICLSSCKLGRFAIYNFADIRDYKKFPGRTIEKDSVTFHFHATDSGKFPKVITFEKKDYTFDEYLKKNKTVAFIIIHNDTVQYENYFRGYDRSSIVPSFSMAKSVLSMLVGCAIEEGRIHSVEDPVTRYLPELQPNGFDKVTVRDLLQMTSGIDFNESYVNPFGQAASFYYGTNLHKEIKKLRLKEPPGTEFDYVSGDSQLLGFVLSRALGDQSISDYFEEKIWKHIGTEFDATWSLDRKDGMEKTFCCVNARAIDYAKLGRLYLNGGNWNGRQLVPATWVEESTRVDTANGSAWFYQYQWWLPTRKGDFEAQGILGQYIYVNPDKDLIIVRLGKNNGKAGWTGFMTGLAAGYD